ncbi:Haloacid dehalogenase-like hydrolase (HAD) superfamily protein, putative isoform 2 [Hibiscus syriacus]|uniref:Mitochondrial import inner membrane translocase subunit TIM50 n=1 Tax=Hibiscus syriacus TaxID=106335 RepID=A0A6A3AC19_HIBSY|nr:Haloacid dehalogenase-like hydrolase (HAD) superfamily protein, putative isoform 2 [Hibiscus syriacus]
MSSIVLRSRILSNKCRSEIINRRVLSSGVDSSSSNSSRETVIASQAILSDQSQVPPPPPAPETAPQGSGGKVWSILKYGLVAAVTGTAGYAGYLSYKCSYEEVDQKAKALRAAASFAPSEDASAVDKYRGLLYSASMAVSAKVLESYLDLKRNLLNQPQISFFLICILKNNMFLRLSWIGTRHYFIQIGSEREAGVPSKDLVLMPFWNIWQSYQGVILNIRKSKHYRDLSKLNRDPAKILYASARAFESSLQPENCVPIKPFKLEGEDTTLLDLIPILEYVARNSPPDIRQVLQSYERKDIAREFLERSKECQRRKQEQRQQQGRFWRR